MFAYFLEYIFFIHENRKIFLFGHRDHSLGKLTEVLCDICWYFRRFAQLKFPASASHTTPLLTPRQSLVVCIPRNIVNDPWVELRNSVTNFFCSSIRKSLLLLFSDLLFMFKRWNVRERRFWGNAKKVHLFIMFIFHIFESIKTVSLHLFTFLWNSKQLKFTKTKQCGIAWCLKTLSLMPGWSRGKTANS